MLAKKTLYYVLLISYFIVSLVFQTTLLHDVFGHFKPNFLLILTVYVALYRSIPEGGALCLVAGYLFDLFSGAPQGLYMFVFILVFFSIKVLSQAFYIHSRHLEILCIFLGSIIFFVLIPPLLSIFTDSLIDTYSFLVRMIVVCCLNTLVAACIYPYCRQLDLMIHKREKGSVAAL